MEEYIYEEDYSNLEEYFDYMDSEDDEERVVKFPMSSSEVNMKDKKCDYKTLAIMTLYSYKNKCEDHRYVYKNHILLNKEEIESLSNNKIDTVCKNIRKLCKLSNKLIEAKNTENGIVYQINYKDENDRKYVIIEEDILRVLLNGCSSNAIKTYILLKYRCQYIHKNEYKYLETKLTRADIASNIGLSPKSKSSLMIVTDIIYTLESLGLIKVRKQYTDMVHEDTQVHYTAKYNYFTIVEYDEWIEIYNNKKI